MIHTSSSVSISSAPVLAWGCTCFVDDAWPICANSLLLSALQAGSAFAAWAVGICSRGALCVCISGCASCRTDICLFLGREDHDFERCCY
jgi:hypothetical protein